MTERFGHWRTTLCRVLLAEGFVCCILGVYRLILMDGPGLTLLVAAGALIAFSVGNEAWP